MELMELWMENVRGWDEMRASHKDLQSVRKIFVRNNIFPNHCTKTVKPLM